MRTKILCFAQIATLVIGVSLLAWYGLARLDAYRGSRAAIAQFEAASGASVAADPARMEPAETPVSSIKADFLLWSRARVAAYERSLSQDPGPAIAILRIPKFRLSVPVFAETSELALNRGAGWIRGTAPPGENGNVGIAGHRDGFFRELKDVGRGDVLELAKRGTTETYVVDRIEIVGPKDVRVLRAVRGRSLTLVTCYPFYYVGSAPRRYVVEASFQQETANHRQSSIPSNSQVKQGEARK
ncbi:MAG TPA: class D sortase [Candidatus Acidoferrales bacterium]|nr:class D sortase [Candidatus Acidoferrales bacterium]